MPCGAANGGGKGGNAEGGIDVGGGVGLSDGFATELSPTDEYTGVYAGRGVFTTRLVALFGALR